jgi:hypothetical protein
VSSPQEWAKAYARQASADFQTWNRLKQVDVPECHRLLFLQMACEKLCKAHLCGRGTDPVHLQSSHGYTAKVLPTIVKEQIGRSKTPNARWVLEQARFLAVEIELLAPAMRRGGKRPDNCEYHWEDHGGVLHVPLDATFPPSNLIATRAGTAFVKSIQRALDVFLV